MGREKKKTPAASRTQAAQARRAKHERSKLYTDGVWQNLAAVNPVPALKHKTYYESIQNTEKKKKLEFEVLSSCRQHVIIKTNGRSRSPPIANLPLASSSCRLDTQS